jgi:hypothetical protein
VSRGSRTCGRWAICAAVPNAFDDTVSPELAQFAVPQARQLGKNLIAVINGESTQPFHYKSKGMFAVIGHRNAVGNPFGVRLSGWLAGVRDVVRDLLGDDTHFRAQDADRLRLPDERVSSPRFSPRYRWKERSGGEG